MSSAAAVLFPYHNEHAVCLETHVSTDRRDGGLVFYGLHSFSFPPLLSPLSPWRGCEVICTLGSDVCVYCRSRGHDRDRFTHPFHVGFLSIRSMSDQLSVFPPFPRNSTLGRAKGPSLAHAPIPRCRRRPHHRRQSVVLERFPPPQQRAVHDASVLMMAWRDALVTTLRPSPLLCPLPNNVAMRWSERRSAVTYECEVCEYGSAVSSLSTSARGRTNNICR